MLNIRKRFFLLLTVVGLLFGIASCTNNNDYVRLTFDNDVYEVNVGQTIDVSPIVNKGSNVGVVTIEYTSYDNQIASYSDGKLTGLQPGETIIKVVCSEHPVAYDIATVRVVANSLPEVEFEPLQLTMLKGTTQTLTYKFVPEYANALMSFTSANPEIATVDEDGVITGVAKGTAVIIVRATDELDETQYRDYTFVIEVLEADFAIQYELNGGTNDPSNPVGYNVLNLPIAIKAATKFGYNFLGWYDNPEFTGNPIEEIAANSTGDITLYAKWEVSIFDITYELNGGQNADENPAQYDINKLPLKLAEPTKLGYKFLGWTLDGTKVEEIVSGTTGAVTLVAEWEVITYNITFDTVGGAWQDLTGVVWPYNKDRAAMVADFVVDFNAHSGKTVAADGSDFFARSWMADNSSAGYNFLVSTEYGAKWGWLLDFINDTRLANGKAVLSAADGQAEARGEIHNFLNACAPGEKGGNAAYGCDYSPEVGGNDFWLYTVDLPEPNIPTTYTVEDEVVLPSVLYKTGYEFVGWMLDGELVETITKGTTGDLTFVAEWAIVEYTITYDLNDGLFDIYPYISREEMVDDFLNDAMAFYGKTSKPNCMVKGTTDGIGFADVFTAIYGIFSSEDYAAKWAWLKDYILATATDANKEYLETGNESYWRYSLGAFLFEDFRSSWPASQDYTDDALANGFWDYLSNGAEPQDTYTVNDEVLLVIPVKAGCEFIGWFLDGTQVNKISQGTTGNLVLVAKWYNPEAELEIDYQLDGGVLTASDPLTFIAKDGLTTLPTPTKVGYLFKGWFEDVECTKAVTSIPSGLADDTVVTLYASWELETYTIEYETNGGQFLTASVAPLYDTFDDLVAAFVNDYANFTGLTGVTAESFYGKSNQYGLYGFFKNEEMAAKWNWLLDFINDKAQEVDYAGKAYLTLNAGAANFNKYARSNFASLLQQTLLTKISPLSMNFSDVDGDALWAACPTKDIQVGIEAKYSYTVLELPLEIATPNKEGATFVGWYTNPDLKNGKIEQLTIENIGNIKLYARWSDSVINYDTYNINYELDGGTLEEGAPTSYVEETGVVLMGATKPGYTFVGWFLDPECTQAVSEFTASDKGDKIVYACWEAVTYTITYEVGDGELPVETVRVSGYDTVEQIVEDLLKDYSAFDGVTYTEPSELGTSAWPSVADLNFGTFYLSTVNGVKMYEKYAWFLEYLLDVNTVGEYNRILTKYKDPTYVEVADDNYAFYYAFKGFVQKMQYRAGNQYWETANFADEAVVNKVLDFAPEAVYEEKPVTSTYTLETLPFVLPTPVPAEGKKFVGWYQNAEFTGDVWFEVPAGTMGDLTLYAKYLNIDEDVKYAISYELDGGTLSVDAPVEYVAGTVLTLTATATKNGYVFKGWFLDPECTQVITEISADTVGNVRLYAGWEIEKVEVEFVNAEGLTTQEMAVGEILPTPTKDGYVFAGWYLDETFAGEAVTTVVGAGKYYAKWEQATYAITFELDGGECDNLPTEYAINQTTTLPVPTKEGFEFVGWLLDGEVVTEIGPDQRGDITLVAEWKEVGAEPKELVVDSNDPEAYATIEAALEAANDGDVILIVAGTYQGFTISKEVTIKGANWGINPVEQSRLEETIFTSDVVIAANNVVIDGIALTEKGRICGSPTGVSNTKLTNIYSYASTVNATATDSATAPIYFVPETGNTNALFENLELSNIKYEGSTGRPMILYGMQIVNLTIKDCSFVGSGTNYNDGIKIDNKAAFGVKGDVKIVNNYFEKYSQYVIWLLSYAGGTYEIKNNTFVDCGQTPGSHAAITLATYNGGEDDKVVLEFQYNTVNDSYMLVRMNANSNAIADNFDVHINYNKLLNCLATYYIKNDNSFTVDGSNNYYDVTPVEGKFIGTDGWETYYENEEDVPAYIDDEAETYAIKYVLNGGNLPSDAPTMYDNALGLDRLPVPTNGDLIFVGWYLDDQKVEAIVAGTSADVTLTARWREDALYVGVGEDYYYPTLAAALADAEDGTKIILLAGTYDEDVTISLANITIAGPNAGVDANSDLREEEAVLTGVITLPNEATNLTIDGLSFTGDARIVANESANYYNFAFINNLVYDTTESTTPWVINRYQMKGFIDFNLPNGGSTNDFYFANNKFTNVSDVNILVNRIVNISVEGNTFVDFDRDAIRAEGGYNQGLISFTNNHFEQTVADNGYNAIFLYALSGPAGTSTTVYVTNNTFKQLGNSDPSAAPYNGAIAAHVYQEQKTAWEITDNVFDDCYNYLYLRNNGATASIWSCKVENNQFLGLPATHYFGSYSGSDTETTNPHLAEFGANYYEDNDGQVITDLSVHAALFKHLKTYGTTLSTAPTTEEATPLEFYTITYELNGGTLKGTYLTAYNSYNTEPIALPTPTRLNFVFLGWALNGDYVAEIPATSKGNIILVAEWEVLEGEIYDVTYDFNGGYSEELLVANGTSATTQLSVNNYNYNNGTFWGGRYTSDIFIGTNQYDPLATFSDRIYIAKNIETGIYEVLSVLNSGPSSWAEGAEYVITISSSYGSYGSVSSAISKIAVGQMVAFDIPIEDISADNPATVYFFNEVPAGDTLVVPSRYSTPLIVPGNLGYEFLGWYDENDILYESLETISGDLKLTAKWKELNPVTGIKVDAICDELTKGQTFQIVASVEPADAYFKDLFYSSNNTDILTVSSTGLVTAVNEGTATITIYDYLNKVSYSHDITVYSLNTIDVTFEEQYNGTINIDDTLQIIATAHGKDMEGSTIKYESSDTDILTVSDTGLVTAVANGEATVKVSIEGTDINITVCIKVGAISGDTAIDKLLALLVNSNFAVVETGNISLYNDGTERVYVPTYGSVNKYLFDEFVVDETYYATTESNPNNHKERRPQDTIEFVTVHDTATLTGTVVSIASGMSSGETSIHYTVGNDAIYGVVPEKYIAYHAGDGTSSTFEWVKTNAVATEKVAPTFGIAQNGSKYYVTVNGVTTTVEAPLINGAAPTAENFTILGPVWDVIDGYYYIGGPLWFSYNQIGSRGGNNNSIGIEMCSNLSGDIYDTFQRTAQLVADILLRNDLDTTRVKMHNTWSGKNCPQTMIAGSYWDTFMEMVELQYEIQKNYSEANISILSNNPDIVDNTGRVINAPEETTTVSYVLTVELNGETRSITLHSVIPGTTTWEQWDGTYPASRIWNNGVFAR